MTSISALNAEVNCGNANQKLSSRLEKLQEIREQLEQGILENFEDLEESLNQASKLLKYLTTVDLFRYNFAQNLSFKKFMLDSIKLFIQRQSDFRSKLSLFGVVENLAKTEINTTKREFLNDYVCESYKPFFHDILGEVNNALAKIKRDHLKNVDGFAEFVTMALLCNEYDYALIQTTINFFESDLFIHNMNQTLQSNFMIAFAVNVLKSFKNCEKENLAIANDYYLALKCENETEAKLEILHRLRKVLDQEVNTIVSYFIDVGMIDWVDLKNAIDVSICFLDLIFKRFFELLDSFKNSLQINRWLNLIIECERDLVFVFGEIDEYYDTLANPSHRMKQKLVFDPFYKLHAKIMNTLVSHDAIKTALLILDDKLSALDEISDDVLGNFIHESEDYVLQLEAIQFFMNSSRKFCKALHINEYVSCYWKHLIREWSGFILNMSPYAFRAISIFCQHNENKDDCFNYVRDLNQHVLAAYSKYLNDTSSSCLKKILGSEQLNAIIDLARLYENEIEQDYHHDIEVKASGTWTYVRKTRLERLGEFKSDIMPLLAVVKKAFRYTKFNNALYNRFCEFYLKLFRFKSSEFGREKGREVWADNFELIVFKMDAFYRELDTNELELALKENIFSGTICLVQVLIEYWLEHLKNPRERELFENYYVIVYGIFNVIFKNSNAEFQARHSQTLKYFC